MIMASCGHWKGGRLLIIEQELDVFSCTFDKELCIF